MAEKPPAAPVRVPSGPLAGRGRRLPLSVWLAVLTALLVGATFVLVAAVALHDRRDTFARAQELTGTVAAVLAEHTDRLIETTDVVRAQIADMVRVAGGTIPMDEASHRRLAALVEKVPHLASIWLGDATGRAVLTSRQFPAPPLSGADRDYFRVPRDRPDAIFIGLLPDNRFSDEVLINTSRRLEGADGSFLGFSQISVSPEHLRALLRRVSVGREAVLLVLDPQGRPLVREPRVPATALAQAIPAGGLPIPAGQASGHFQAVSPFDKVERLYSFQRSPEYGLVVVAGTSVADIERHWRDHVWVYGLSGLALVVGFLAVGAVLTDWARRQETSAALLNREVEARTRDLTEALGEKEALLAELNHRVKNAFATVQALMLQTIRTAPDLAAFKASFSDRLGALARTHVLLTAADGLKGTTLRTLLEHELAPYAEGERVRLAGDEVGLDPNRTLALGLVLHELATNAAKYGALAAPAGRIAVDWRVSGGAVEVQWLESGGPPVAASVQEGFGSKLLQRSLSPYGGTVERRFAPEGVSVRIRLPL